MRILGVNQEFVLIFLPKLFYSFGRKIKINSKPPRHRAGYLQGIISTSCRLRRGIYPQRLKISDKYTKKAAPERAAPILFGSMRVEKVAGHC
jgi:hypothetical protein